MSKPKTARAPSNRPPAVFPHPDPDHARCAKDAMAGGEALCAQRGQRLTPIRRNVLAALLASHKPLGAYEIIGRLALKGPRLAPITTFRALEFLRENGLVHRFERRDAFFAIENRHARCARTWFAF